MEDIQRCAGDDHELLRLGGLAIDLSDLAPAFTPRFPLSVVAALHLIATRRWAGADDCRLFPITSRIEDR